MHPDIKYAQVENLLHFYIRVRVKHSVFLTSWGIMLCEVRRCDVTGCRRCMRYGPQAYQLQQRENYH